jgi:hypothetical protein
MRKASFILAITGIFLFTGSYVFAVGSGSGGSIPQQPSCSADIWSCGEWGSCSALGRQTRTCTLSFDCPYATTPKPAEEQSCTPPQPEQKPTAPEQNQPEQTPPVSGPNQKPSCTADRFECGPWSSSCNISGLEERTCRKVFDCPSVDTPQPETQRPCSHLQCGNKASLRERISCRLNLAPAGIVRELQIQYLPEECRALQNEAVKNACIARYKSYEPCWNIPAGEKRFACARNVLKLGPVISEEVKTCQGKTGVEQVACKNEVKDKVFSMIKFRFYDLEERAEKLAERGADLNAVADLETIIESKKQAFNSAQTKAERRQIILDVRQAWQEFVNKVKDQVK